MKVFPVPNKKKLKLNCLENKRLAIRLIIPNYYFLLSKDEILINGNLINRQIVQI